MLDVCFLSDEQLTSNNKRQRSEGEIKNGQSRETANIWYTWRRKAKQKHNTTCVGHHYVQANIDNVNKTWSLLQTTGDIKTNRT